MIPKSPGMKVVFIVIFLTAFCIPNVNAEKIPDSSLAIAAGSVPLPDLQFNDSQEKVTVYQGISPEKAVQTGSGGSSSTLMVQNTMKTTIPQGSIIYHENNITSIFDPDGHQILITDDNTAETIHTFKGDVPATFIHEVPDNSVVIDAGDRLYIVHNNTRILTIIASRSDNLLTSSGSDLVEASSWPSSCMGQPYNSQWIEGAESSISSSSVKEFSADWNVPEKPVINENAVTIWNGLRSCVPGDPHIGLVQPVLELAWPGQGPHWTMSNWYVWSNSSIAPNVDSIIVDRKTTVNDGDKMRGDIQINTAGYDAIGKISDLGPNGGGSSVLYLTSATAPTRMPYQNLYAQIVLEGTGVKKQKNATYLVGPVIFNNFVLTDHNDNNLIPSINMIPFKNLPEWDQLNFTGDSQNLTIYNRWPTDITLVNNLYRINPPVTDFSTTVPVHIGTTTVPFRDGSTGSPFLWLWDFGDGSTSIERYQQNPSHSYNTTGTFNVSLTTWNAGGFDPKIKFNYITILSPFGKPMFFVNIFSGIAPLTVQFTDQSTGDIIAWNWTFGDGNATNSTLQNPVHTYYNTGTYSVSLAVKNSSGYWNSTTINNYITVAVPPPLANFTASPTSGPVPLTVQFTDTSTGNVTGWLWDFGDGNTTNATAQNPVHTYSFTRDFINVSLTAMNAGGSNTTTRVNYICVGDCRDTIGLYNTSSAIFYLRNSNSGGYADNTFGYGWIGSGDLVPLTGHLVWNSGG